MQLNIRHTTTYCYDQPVDYALQKVRLRPQQSLVQSVLNWDIAVKGGVIETHYNDHYGNHVDLVNVDRGAQEVMITATGTVDTHTSVRRERSRRRTGPQLYNKGREVQQGNPNQTA